MASIAQWLEILSEGRVVTAIDLPGSFHCDFFRSSLVLHLGEYVNDHMMVDA
jgi:hypothetical protein